MSLFRKAGEKFEETKRAFSGGSTDGEETAEEEGDPFVCTACGERLAESVAHCPHCGEAAVEPVENVENDDTADSTDTTDTDETAN